MHELRAQVERENPGATAGLDRVQTPGPGPALPERLPSGPALPPGVGLPPGPALPPGPGLPSEPRPLPEGVNPLPEGVSPPPG
jgi:hypothetical protein